MGGRVKIYPWAWFDDWFFFLVLRCLVTEAFQGGKNSNRLPSISFFDSPFLEGLLRYIFPFHWSWPSICWLCRLLLECLSHLPPSSTCCELQQPKWYCSGVISSLIRPDRQLWAFNAEVIASHGIAPPPWFHGWPTVLVLFVWDVRGGCLQGRAAFSFRDLGSPRTGLSSATSPGSLDFLCSSSDISSSSAWALGLIWNELGLPNPLAPH